MPLNMRVAQVSCMDLHGGGKQRKRENEAYQKLKKSLISLSLVAAAMLEIFTVALEAMVFSCRRGRRIALEGKYESVLVDKEVEGVCKVRRRGI